MAQASVSVATTAGSTTTTATAEARQLVEHEMVIHHRDTGEVEKTKFVMPAAPAKREDKEKKKKKKPQRSRSASQDRPPKDPKRKDGDDGSGASGAGATARPGEHERQGEAGDRLAARPVAGQVRGSAAGSVITLSLRADA